MDELIPDPNPTKPAPAGMHYAGFWRRFNAYGIDCSIIWLASIGLQYLVMDDLKAFQQIRDLFGPVVSGQITPETAPQLVDTLIASLSGGAVLGAEGNLLLILSALYNIFFVHGSWQATPGKRWLNCKVLNADGSPLTLQQSALRHAASGISAVLSMIPCVTVLFTRDKLAPHDMLCHTRVIHQS